MAQPDTADRDGLALVKQAMDDLGRGVWQPDVAQFEAAIAATDNPAVKARLANLLTHQYFRSGEMDAALKACETWLQCSPENSEAHESHASILIRLGRHADALAAAEARIAVEPDNHRVYAALANAAAQLGDLETARRHGTTCLEMQDRQATSKVTMRQKVDVPPFDPLARERNIIAFSLFGDNPRYTDGAIRNVVAAQLIYPEWSCRFYVDDTVPKAVVRRIEREGGMVRQVFGMPAARFGTFWRFLIAQDEQVDRFLVRDCDGLVGLRERAAVEDWIASDQPFHVMRDAYVHTDLVLAGMWGGVRGSLWRISRAMQTYLRTAPYARTVDQQFLRDWAWPQMKGRVLAHDSCYDFGGAVPFPARADVPGVRVGQSLGVRAS